MSRIENLTKRTGVQTGSNCKMDKDQRLEEGRVEAEDPKLNQEDSSDQEEVKLLPHRKGADEPDLPGADIRGGPGGIGHVAGRMVAYDGASSWGSAEVE